MIVYNKKKIGLLAVSLVILVMIAFVAFLVLYYVPQKRAAHVAEQRKIAAYKNAIAEFRNDIRELDIATVIARFIEFQQNEKDNPFLNDAKIAASDQVKGNILSLYQVFDYSNKDSYFEMQKLAEMILSFDILNGTPIFNFAKNYLDMMNSSHMITIHSIQVTTSYKEGVYFDKCVCISEGGPKEVIFEKETGLITSLAPMPSFRTPQLFPCQPWDFHIKAFTYRYKDSILKRDDEKGWLSCDIIPGEGSKTDKTFKPDDRIHFIISYSINFKTLSELLSAAGISVN